MKVSLGGQNLCQIEIEWNNVLAMVKLQISFGRLRQLQSVNTIQPLIAVHVKEKNIIKYIKSSPKHMNAWSPPQELELEYVLQIRW